MHKAKLRAVGGSVMVAIPPHILDALELGPNADVEMSLDGTRLIVCPKPRASRMGLAARLAMCNFAVPTTAEEKEWLEAPPAGREEL